MALAQVRPVAQHQAAQLCQAQAAIIVAKALNNSAQLYNITSLNKLKSAKKAILRHTVQACIVGASNVGTLAGIKQAAPNARKHEQKQGAHNAVQAATKLGIQAAVQSAVSTITAHVSEQVAKRELSIWGAQKIALDLISGTTHSALQKMPKQMQNALVTHQVVQDVCNSVPAILLQLFNNKSDFCERVRKTATEAAAMEAERKLHMVLPQMITIAATEAALAWLPSLPKMTSAAKVAADAVAEKAVAHTLHDRTTFTAAQNAVISYLADELKQYKSHFSVSKIVHARKAHGFASFIAQKGAFKAANKALPEIIREVVNKWSQRFQIKAADIESGAAEEVTKLGYPVLYSWAYDPAYAIAKKAYLHQNMSASSILSRQTMNVSSIKQFKEKVMLAATKAASQALSQENALKALMLTANRGALRQVVYTVAKTVSKTESERVVNEEIPLIGIRIGKLGAHMVMEETLRDASIDDSTDRSSFLTKLQEPAEKAARQASEEILKQVTEKSAYSAAVATGLPLAFAMNTFTDQMADAAYHAAKQSVMTISESTMLAAAKSGANLLAPKALNDMSHRRALMASLMHNLTATIMREAETLGYSVAEKVCIDAASSSIKGALNSSCVDFQSFYNYFAGHFCLYTAVVLCLYCCHCLNSFVPESTFEH